MNYGYARVSTSDQDTTLQREALLKAGVLDVREETMSAVKKRPVLDALLATLQPGDVLVVYKLDRLARSVADFVRILAELRKRGAAFKSLTESLDTATPGSRMFVQLLAVFAEYEREMIRERCLAGQRAARARGAQWGRPRLMSDQDCADAAKLWNSGWWDQETLADVFGVTVACLRDGIHRAEGRGRWATKQANARAA
jgi:DNA invertase Pin-like site-specific DNA recombinase